VRDYERRAVADAAYDAWRSGRNYDDAWDAAQDAIEYYQPLDKFDAEEIAESAVKREGR
jgi:hypothetical protein